MDFGANFFASSLCAVSPYSRAAPRAFFLLRAKPAVARRSHLAAGGESAALAAPTNSQPHAYGMVEDTHGHSAMLHLPFRISCPTSVVAVGIFLCHEV